MGRTILPARIIIEEELSSLQKFRDSLRKEDAEAFDRLILYPKLHIPSITYACRLNPFESILLAMMLEQEKEISLLKKDQEGRRKEEKTGGQDGSGPAV